jgi:hypothetical protein
MKVKMTLSVNFCEKKYEEIIDIEFANLMSEDELYKEWREWASNFIGGGFELLEDS